MTTIEEAFDQPFLTADQVLIWICSRRPDLIVETEETGKRSWTDFKILFAVDYDGTDYGKLFVDPEVAERALAKDLQMGRLRSRDRDGPISPTWFEEPISLEYDDDGTYFGPTLDRKHPRFRPQDVLARYPFGPTDALSVVRPRSAAQPVSDRFAGGSTGEPIHQSAAPRHEQQPNADQIVTHSGAPGRPTGMPFIIAEMERRLKAGETFEVEGARNISHFADAVHKWAKSYNREINWPLPKTMMNADRFKALALKLNALPEKNGLRRSLRKFGCFASAALATYRDLSSDRGR